MRLLKRPWPRRPDEAATELAPFDLTPEPAAPVVPQTPTGPVTPPSTVDSPSSPAGPVDLPSDAPVIGRAGSAQQGHIRPGTALKPPAVALDGTAAGSYQVAAASLIGASHVQSGQPRQDSYNFMVGRSGKLYVTIADGLGSKAASQLGAYLFSESVLVAAADAEAEGNDAEQDPARLLTLASARMTRIVTDTYRLDTRTVGCVGAVAVFSEEGCAIARVGDVSAFTLVDGDFVEAFVADAGLVNVVSASMPGECEDDVECVALAPVPTVVLGTDGLANDVRNSTTLRKWLADRWCVPHLPFAIGDTLRYRRQGSHDDRTAVVVWRTQPETQPG
jgi:serine/threonine protein phosphatase PrpC